MSRRSLLCLLAAALAACADAPPRRERPLRTVLAHLDPGTRRGTIVVSADGRQVAWVERSGDGQRVARVRSHDIVRGPVFAACGGLRFAARGDRLSYWAAEANDGERRILRVADTTTPTPFTRQPVTAVDEDGSRWAAVGSVAPAGVAVVVDGREVGRWPDASMPAFDRDGRRIAVLVEGDDGRVRLVIDGTEVRAFESPAGRPPDPRSPPPGLSPRFAVRWLADGSLLVLAQDADGWAVLHDDRRIASYGHSLVPDGGPVVVDPGPAVTRQTTIAPATLVAATSAPTAAWWERIAGPEGRWRVVRMGIPIDGRTCTRAGGLALSDDGRTVAYACVEGGPGDEHATVVHGDATFGPWADVFGLALSSSGRRVAYAAAPRRAPPGGSAPARWRFHVDDRAVGPDATAAWRPRFTPDGRHLAWESELDGRKVLGIDARVVTRFDDVLWGPDVETPGRVGWVIRRGNRLVRLDVAAG